MVWVCREPYLINCDQSSSRVLVIKKFYCILSVCPHYCQGHTAQSVLVCASQIIAVSWKLLQYTLFEASDHHCSSRTWCLYFWSSDFQDMYKLRETRSLDYYNLGLRLLHSDRLIFCLWLQLWRHSFQQTRGVPQRCWITLYYPKLSFLPIKFHRNCVVNVWSRHHLLLAAVLKL